MATSNDLLIKQRSVIEFLVAKGCSATNIHARMKTVYGEMCISDCAVSKWLTVEMKAQRKNMSIQVLERYNAEGEAFLQRILTGDESWVHHYDPECKAQSMEYRHKTFPKSELRRFRHDEDSILQHDNARPHTSRQTQDALRQLKLTTLPHPAYSPDLAPSDYYLFPQLKNYLKGHPYDNDEEVIADVRRWCRGQSSEFFADGVRQLVGGCVLIAIIE
ncbi:transposase [Plakobranchus ocellatus]|uniref:Transposase n=1 Tax=Plakobranchus ocellatus TaxID=259542 RepID=A0AAV3XYP8_9GAST|nr:transposase [Plakobranchus ocellatus]